MGRLFWKFFFASWLVQAIAVLALSTGVWFKDKNAARRNARVDFGPPAAFAVDAAAHTLRYGGLQALRALLQEHGWLAVYAVDSKDHELLDRTTSPTLLQQLRQLHETDPNSHALQEVKTQDETWLLFAARQPRPPGGAVGGVHPAATSGLGAMRGTGDGIIPRAHRPPRDNYFPVMPMLLAMLGSLVSAALMAWHFAKPIRRLRNAVDAVAHGKLDTRVGAPAKGGDELTELSRDFDRMAQQLENSADAQRQLLHDVSHEMRSPLARLQAAIGLARQRPERVDTWLDRIERESERMDGMIGDVLALARLDGGVDQALDEDISVDELVAQVADDAGFEAQAAGKSVRIEAHGPASVRGSAELLHSAIENVMRNAVKHTPEGSEVTVTVSRDEAARKVRISVCDQGPGVPPGELELIFRPFQRGSQNGNLPGNGLGLAIADRVVRKHGGSIHAHNRDSGGLCVEIALPLAEHA
ncbi:ATP-binding protein [Massilia terrae]|uniref:Signal transduction histidine-protein kinase/phosphatase MprB n=1 Tax=Massilia terrae TaxID=1811224 RepID=A0ABT2D4V7_9BURK|nr:ATP-binding protein [Massilia terrae]MCS0660383.1 ATP-binding protein [Massilia terrae]